MAKFRKSRQQAIRAIRGVSGIGTPRHGNRNDRKIHAIGTARNYVDALSRVGDWLKSNGHMNGIRTLTSDLALAYLQERAEEVRQSALDQDRQALRVLPQFKDVAFPRFRSALATIRRARAYTPEQVELVAAAQAERNRLASRLASVAGLRAHELFTIRKVSEQPASGHRAWHGDRFAAQGWTAMVYSVKGKGGLTREVAIPEPLARELENRRLAEPRLVTDRKVRYLQQYDIGGGQAWSQSFTDASKRVLRWSTGAHGVRHGYAQRRMDELQAAGRTYKAALAIVSQEMGHYRPEITEVYLR